MTHVGTKNQTTFVLTMLVVCTKGLPKQYRNETGSYYDVEAQYYVTLKCKSPGHVGVHNFWTNLIHERSSSFHKDQGHFIRIFWLIIPGLYHKILNSCDCLNVTEIWRYAFTEKKKSSMFSNMFAKDKIT